MKAREQQVQRGTKMGSRVDKTDRLQNSGQLPADGGRDGTGT